MWRCGDAGMRLRLRMRIRMGMRGRRRNRHESCPKKRKSLRRAGQRSQVRRFRTLGVCECGDLQIWTCGHVCGCYNRCLYILVSIKFSRGSKGRRGKVKGGLNSHDDGRKLCSRCFGGGPVLAFIQLGRYANVFNLRKYIFRLFYSYVLYVPRA